jgi:hypothetical protein
MRHHACEQAPVSTEEYGRVLQSTAAEVSGASHDRRRLCRLLKPGRVLRRFSCNEFCCRPLLLRPGNDAAEPPRDATE